MLCTRYLYLIGRHLLMFLYKTFGLLLDNSYMLIIRIIYLLSTRLIYNIIIIIIEEETIVTLKTNVMVYYNERFFNALRK